MKNKISFVTPLYSPADLSGSSVMVKKIAELLAKNDYDVTVITSNALTGRYWYDPIFGKKISKTSEVINGVKIHRLSCNQLISSLCFILVKYLYFLIPLNLLNKLKIIYSGPYLRGLEKIFIKEKFDTVHCSPFPLNINRQVAKVIKKYSKETKLVFTPLLHTELKEFKNPELGKIISEADKIHVITNSEKDFLENFFKVDSRKVTVFPLFLDTDKMINMFELNKEIENFRSKHKLTGKKIILFAGNKGYLKGAITLLEAISDLYKKDDSYKLVAIGKDMPEWNKEKKRINTNFLLDLNYVDEKTKEIIFASCDLYCMPSISESFGLTYLEAWHKKKPVIAASVASSKEIVGMANGGLLVKFDDREDLKDKIRQIFKDKEKSKKMGQNGYNALYSKYNIDEFYKNFVSII